MPANTEIYIQEFTKLIEFDILNPDGIGRKITGDPDFKLASFIAGIREKNEGEPNMMDDLGFFVILLGIGACALCVMGCVYQYRKYREKIMAIVKKLVDNFMFNGFIRAITIAYIQLCMSFGG